jgi:membrane protease YdiL (CAAX protease family)
LPWRRTGGLVKRAVAVSATVVAAFWIYTAVTQLTQPHPVPPTVASIASHVAIRTAIVLALVAVLLRSSGETIGSLGFSIDGIWRFVARTLLLSVGLFILSNVILVPIFSALLGKGGSVPIAGLFRDRRDLPFWIFSAVVGGGFGEELARAFALTRFEKLFGRAGLAGAFVVDSLVFGSGHLYQGPASAAGTVVTGMVLAWIFLKRRRVIDAMAVHAVFDLMGIAAGYMLYGR